VVGALVVLLVAGSVGMLGTALLLRSQGPAGEAAPDQPRVMHVLPPVPPPARTPKPVAAQPVRPLPPPPRPVRRCGHCRTAGHTRALCPRLTGIQMLPTGPWARVPVPHTVERIPAGADQGAATR
jgi:hypothetical protein